MAILSEMEKEAEERAARRSTTQMVDEVGDLSFWFFCKSHTCNPTLSLAEFCV